MTTTLTAPPTLAGHKAPNPVMFIAARQAVEATGAPFGSAPFWTAYAEVRNRQIAYNVTPADMLAHPEDYEPEDVERARRFLGVA